MEEKRIFKLVRSAVEVDELEAALTGVVDTRETAAVGTKRGVRWWFIGVPITAVAAVIAWGLLLPSTSVINEPAVIPLAMTDSVLCDMADGSFIDEFEVLPPVAVRGSDAGLPVINLSLNRDAYIRVVLIDKHHERWIMPFDDEQTTYVKQFKAGSFQMNFEPKPDDPRGPVKAVVAMVIASLGPTPSADELLETISDPVVPPKANEQTLLREIERTVAKLQARFDCEVRFELTPQPE